MAIKKGRKHGKSGRAKQRRVPRSATPKAVIKLGLAPTPSTKVSATAARPTPTARLGFAVVGIGASAGGLAALQAFFEAVPGDCGLAFVVVTHQHPGHSSLLPEILGRHAAMPVVQIVDAIAVRPNQVYVSPPGKNVAIIGGTLRTTDLVRDHELELPIDFFLRSLARDFQERAICVVLSGTGTDGTLGLRAIKGESGMALVQDESSAGYAGMPHSAAATQLADHVLLPESMPAQILSYVRDLDQSAASEDIAEREPDDMFRQIFSLLQRRTGQDFAGYKLNTVRRRVERRMRVHQVSKPAEYVRMLRSNPHELDQLLSELLISVTNFFRDREAFDALKAALSTAMASRTDDRPLRVWVPGCATGEEAYSIGMILAELAEERNVRVNCQIFGTDLDIHAIEHARAGLYPQGVAADIGRKRLMRFFVAENNFYRIKKEIRELMVFATQNVIKDPPFTKLDLISCRNLLIYLNPQIQQRIFPLFHYALVRGGLLMLGTSETIGTCVDLFAPIDRKWKLYERIPGVTRPMLMPTEHAAPRQARMTAVSDIRASSGTSSLPALLQSHLLHRFALPTVIVNGHGDIVYVHGKTGRYLEPISGEPSNNLFTMARDGLRNALPSALRRSSLESGEIVHKGVVGRNDGRDSVNVRVQRLEDPEALRGLFRVSFETEVGEKGTTPIRKQTSRDGPDVHQELKQTRDTLQGTVEALQTSNEELKSSNEELQSTNEELQSTNEELETSKEELQSLNEELQTLNGELQTKMEEVARSNDDMQNLLNSTEIATLFLDRELKIKRFTNQAHEVVRLMPRDIGRPIGDLVSQLRYDALERDARRVLESLSPEELEIQTATGEWRLLRMRPYRTSQNVIDGVVITLIDIDRVKRAELLASSREYAESIVQTVREPLLVLDTDFRVVSANPAFFRVFRLEPQQVRGQILFEMAGGLLALPRLRELLAEVVTGGAPLQDTKIEHDFATIGRRCFIVNARRLEGEAASARQILVALSGMTDSTPF